MKLSSHIVALAMLAALFPASLAGERFELIRYGNFDSWLTRHIKESRLLGGDTKTIYEICPAGVDDSGDAYSNRGGSPWATSNVLAKPAGIAKTSNAVSPEARAGHGKCARLECKIEKCKVIGIVNLEVLVGGSVFLGEMMEPVTSTSNPNSHFEMGVPFTGRPEALQFDYKFYLPDTDHRVCASGFGSKKTIAGVDNGETIVLLQRRWEDKDGNIYAKRVGTGREVYGKTTPGWIDNHRLAVVYGKEGRKVKDLITKEKSYYARNSKGKMMPVVETGWESETATPTHAVVMFSAAAGDPFTGTPGLTLWIDNVGWVY